MTKIEEVARAIWTVAHHSDHPDDPTWENWPKTGREASLAYADYSKDDFMEFAKVALYAMREPCEAAIKAGVHHRLLTTVYGQNNWQVDTAALWRAMVDAMLTSPSRP